MKEKSNGLMRRMSDLAFSFAKNRFSLSFSWLVFSLKFSYVTTSELIKFPVYGLLNPKSELPPYALDAAVVESVPKSLFDIVVAFVSAFALIPAAVVGLVMGPIIGGILGLKVESIISSDAVENNHIFIAAYLNDHVMRQSVMRYGVVGALAAAIVFPLAGFASLAYPAVLTSGIAGAAVGAVRGTLHKWHIDRVLLVFRKIRVEINLSSVKEELKKRFHVDAFKLAKSAMLGDLNAMAKIEAFDVKSKVRIANIESELVGMNAGVAKMFADRDAETKIQEEKPMSRESGVDIRIDNLNSALDSIGGRLESINRSILNLHLVSNTHKDTLTRNDATLKEISLHLRDLYAESSSLTSGLRISDRTIADLILELSKVGHSVAALAENVQTCDSKIHELDSTWPKLPCFKESMGAPDLAHSASDVQPAQSGAKVKSRFSAAVGH